MKSIFVVGGSNSLLGGGWVSEFRKSHGERYSITNLSIGAATSLIGIYRLLRGEISDGSTVIWEYALNESNHLNSGQSLESLLYHFDWLLELCSRRHIKVLPLVFWTRPEHLGGVENSYRTQIRRRIEDAGLRAIDAWPMLLNFAQERDQTVGSLFRDDMHYSPDSGFLTRISQAVAEKIDTAAVPRGGADFDGKDLALCAPEGASERFVSSAFTSETYDLNGRLEMPATGWLLASFVIAANEAGAATFSVDKEILATYSLQGPAGFKPPGRFLKHLVHWTCAEDIKRASSSISVLGTNPTDRPKIQNMFAWRGPFANGHRDDAYICSLIEVEGC